MKNLDEKLVNIYELLGDYLEKAGYFEEKEEEVKEESEENEENNDEKDETYTEEEVQEILNRE